jgi:pyruvate dehydrogenase E2 component (dihydrolipoamide acetyltransferase)
MESDNPPKTSGSGKGETERVELSRPEQTLARRMAESKATVPHVYFRSDVDMSQSVRIQAAFAQTAAEGEPVPSLDDMVVKAVALALREHPRANGSYRDGGLELYSRINVGIALATEDTVTVPTVTDADRLSLGEMAAESRRLNEQVRSGQITASDLSGGTFTILSLGGFGVRDFDPVIHGGQAGMLAVGEVAERPVVRDGELTAAHLMELSLACDHRILYGAEAAGLLAAIRTNLEDPGRLT